MRCIAAASWFDGDRFHPNPVRISIVDGRVAGLDPGPAGPADEVVAFACPGLVEGHAHLFLDGDERGFAARKAHLTAGREAWLKTGRANLARYARAGITTVRDAGDAHGINHTLRDEGGPVRLLSAGAGIRAAGRYGSFFADELAHHPEAAVERVAASGADQVKLVVSGIIDFAAGRVKGAPQFDLATLTRLVRAAHEHRLPTLAHCSGRDGLARALAAGVDSIEHGFFLEPDDVQRMADQGTAWVPTFAPVDAVRDDPVACRLDEAAVGGVERILDHHRRMLAVADAFGVDLVAGSDAGSWGVAHVSGLHHELGRMAAAGLSTSAVLRSATSTPRRRWRLAGERLAVGAEVDLVGFARRPDRDGFDLGPAVLRASTLTATSAGPRVPAWEPALV